MTQSFAADLMDMLDRAKLTVVDKPWGQEVIIDAGEFLLKLIDIKDGYRTSKQYHPVKDETNCIVAGSGTIEGVLDDGARPSKFHRIFPGDVHRSVGPVILLEVSTNDPDDIVRLEDDYGR